MDLTEVGFQVSFGSEYEPMAGSSFMFSGKNCAFTFSHVRAVCPYHLASLI
jgi:hypothetical protein